MRIRSLFCVLLAILVAPAAASYRSVDELKYLEDFRLIDQDDRSHSLYYYGDYPYVLLISHSDRCSPHTRRFKDLVRFSGELESMGVKVLAVDSNPDSTRESARLFLQRQKVFIPILMDPLQIVFRTLGKPGAGDALLFETKNWSLVDKGSLLGQACYNSILNRVTGKPSDKLANCSSIGHWERIRNQLSLWFGTSRCEIPELPRQIWSYSKDAAPVIRSHCQDCHSRNKGYGAFENYQDVFGWSTMIWQVLRTHRMPPGGLDSHYGSFMNFSDDEGGVRPLIEWIEQGAVQDGKADPLTRPSPQVRAKRPGLYSRASLSNGEAPTVVWKMNHPQRVPPTGVLDYQYVQLAGPLTEDLWISSLRIKVNSKVTHHANLISSTTPILAKNANQVRVKGLTEESAKLHDDRTLATTVRGRAGIFSLPEGVALEFKKGSYVGLEFHYQPDGRHEKNQASVELWAYKDSKPPRALRRMITPPVDFVIPPRTKDFAVKTASTIDQDITVIGIHPHMHYRGKSARYILKDPSGKTEVLLNVPYFQFKFQPYYTYQKPKFIPKGSSIETIFTYDNSERNPINPNPHDHVARGDQTSTEEMYFLRIFYVEGRYP